MNERFKKVSLDGSKSQETDLEVVIRRIEMVEDALEIRLAALEAKLDLLRHHLGIETVDFEILSSERAAKAEGEPLKLRRRQSPSRDSRTSSTGHVSGERAA